jgi:hypothetical protein
MREDVHVGVCLRGLCADDDAEVRFGDCHRHCALGEFSVVLRNRVGDHHLRRIWIKLDKQGRLTTPRVDRQGRKEPWVNSN